MRLTHLKHAAVSVGRNMEKHHTMAFAAALAYYFVLALFPFLIFLSAVVAHLPLPNFFGQVMGLIAQVVPAANMGPLRRLMTDTILSTHSRLLTFGILLTLWSASSGFTALIDALNTAYDVSETRRYWKTRGLAIVLTFSVGCLLVIALGLLVAGPSLSAKLTDAFGRANLWPYLRWGVAIGCTILAVELLYFVAPKCEATIREHVARSYDRCRRLDRIILPARNLFPGFFRVQQGLWQPGRSTCIQHLALLDRLRGLDRCTIQCRTSAGSQGEAGT